MSIVASVLLIYQLRRSPPSNGKSNTQKGRNRKLKPTAPVRRTGSQKEKLWVFSLPSHSWQRKQQIPSQGFCPRATAGVTTLETQIQKNYRALKCSAGKLGNINLNIHNQTWRWILPASTALQSQCQSNFGVWRQTSEDQTRLILLQISPQEMGSAGDLMFCKAVVIRLKCSLWRADCHCYTWRAWAWSELWSGSCPWKEVCLCCCFKEVFNVF